MKDKIKSKSDEQALALARQWSEMPCFAAEDRQELLSLLENDPQLVIERFYKDLEFGTAGLRGIVGFGPNCLNQYTLSKASYAYGLVLKEHFQNPKVVVSYDSRLSSQQFSKIAVAVFNFLGIQTYLMPRETATPLLSFAVRSLKCQGGVMITASHNPKDYNGYKVYWQDGAQVSPPYDQEIINRYYQINFEELPRDVSIREELNQVLGEDFYQSYFQTIIAQSLRPDLIKEKGAELKIIYTPLHGTGAHPVGEVFRQLGFHHLMMVPEQAQPDGHFPTTSRPNPEELQALKMGCDLMLKENADLLIGSDPDTDRMGVMVNLGEGEARFLNGNEIAVLLLEYKLSSLKQLGLLKENPVVIKTLVTSSLQDRIAEHYGAKVYQTMTGFKWMAKVIKQLELNGDDFQMVMASEESFGSMTHSAVRDKDGVSAAALMSEAALYYKSTRGMNLVQALEEIHDKYGTHQEELINLEYPGKQGMEKIQSIMQFFRSSALKQLGEFKVTDSSDYLHGEPSGNLIRVQLDGQFTLFLRPSGTEPKIKFYLQIVLRPGEEASMVPGIISAIKRSIEEFCERI